ncbi:MAG: cysteine hydrolase [Candidatus Omnitrophica bacterium]|nr:cysteine hydrolase [Candidatus Omnitrophota bacterium]
MGYGILVIDLQNEYFPGGHLELVNIQEVAAKAKRLMDAGREASVPVFHIRHIQPDPDSPIFQHGTQWIEIHESVKPEEGETVITKHFPNSFRASKLGEVLKEKGIDKVIVCGAMSDVCVDATVRAAADLGFQCVVAQDACTTRNIPYQDKTIAAGDAHGVIMTALGMFYAQVVDTDQAISMIQE